MYYYREAGKKVYTLSPTVHGKFVERAHPAPFSPTDLFSKYRIRIKRRYSIYPFDTTDGMAAHQAQPAHSKALCGTDVGSTGRAECAN